MSRRLLITIVAVLVVVLAISGLGVAFAFSHVGQPSTSATTTPTPSATPNAKTNKTHSVMGVISSLNNQTLVLTVPRHNKTVTVTVSDSTKYATLEGPTSFSDLKVGQTVQVAGHLNTQDQTLQALRVLVLPPMGKVASVNGQTFMLTTTGSKTVTVNTTSSTFVYVRIGEKNVPVSAHFIAAGQTIGYEGTSAGNNAVSATKLWLFGLPQVHGTVSVINSNTLTLQTAQGSNVTITLSPNTTYVQAGKSASTATPTTVNAQAVHVGNKVTIVANGPITSGSPTAVLVVVM